jgi:hypothetical protein
VGLYDGLCGAAFTLQRLGHRQQALAVIERVLKRPLSTLGADLYAGLAGIGLTLLHFATGTGDTALHDHAIRVADELATRLLLAEQAGQAPSRAGLMHGCCGAALLWLRLYERTEDNRYLDHAATAVRRDLRRCRTDQSGAMRLDDGRRALPYLAEGSTGIGLVVDQYLHHRDDHEFRRAHDAITRAARGRLYVLPGLFRGLAGIAGYLTHIVTDPATPAGVAPYGDRSREQTWALVERHLDRLARYAVPYRAGLAFPGERLLRLSMDLATGTAGVLLAATAAASRAPVALPLIGSTSRASAPAPTPKGGDTQ